MIEEHGKLRIDKWLWAARFFLNQVGIPPSEYRRAASRPEPESAPDAGPAPESRS